MRTGVPRGSSWPYFNATDKSHHLATDECCNAYHKTTGRKYYDNPLITVLWNFALIFRCLQYHNIIILTFDYKMT